MVTEKDIINTFLGIPYKHRGRDLSGLDCWGLIKLVYNKLGYTLWDIEEEYTQDWSFKGKNHFIENYHKEWDKVISPNIYDVVLFKNGKGIANHGGIMLLNNRFIHSCRIGTIISRLSNEQWKRRIEGFYRLRIKDDNS